VLVLSPIRKPQTRQVCDESISSLRHFGHFMGIQVQMTQGIISQPFTKNSPQRRRDAEKRINYFSASPRLRGVKYEPMSFKARSWVMALTTVLGVGAYWGARHYSPALIWYVVEETLIRKAPERISPDQARLRLRDYLASLPDGRTRVERLLEVSQRLEKIQKL
jgi:hypothetical protein